MHSYLLTETTSAVQSCRNTNDFVWTIVYRKYAMAKYVLMKLMKLQTMQTQTDTKVMLPVLGEAGAVQVTVTDDFIVLLVWVTAAIYNVTVQHTDY